MEFSETFDQVKKWCLGIRNREEAETGIHRDSLLQQSLKTWSKRLGKAAIVLGVLALLTHAAFFLFPAGAAIVGYGLVKGASIAVNHDIRNKQAAEQKFAAEEQAATPAAKPAPRQPAPRMPAKVTGSFNAKVPPAPANDAPPAPAAKLAGFLKRFGIGG